MRFRWLLVLMSFLLGGAAVAAQKPESQHQAHKPVAAKAIAKAQVAAAAKVTASKAAARKSPRKATRSKAPRKPQLATARRASGKARTVVISHTRARTHKPARYAAATGLVAGAGAGLPQDASGLHLQSASFVVIDRSRNQVLLARKPDERTSIASITKLMTAMVILDARLPLDQSITIDNADVDHFKRTSSRLAVGTTLPRRDILRLALMSSENRAAASLARTYPGGRARFIAAMNAKARQLGMASSSFADPAGLNPNNISTANDVAKMVQAASGYLLIREFTTTTGRTVSIRGGRSMQEYNNTNRLVRYKDPDWQIELSKTGYTAEAGRCLVMQARAADRPLILVLLDSPGKLTPIGDANRVRLWLESHRVARGLASN